MARAERFVSGKNASLIWQGSDKARKNLANEALRELKKKSMIHDFLSTGDLNVINLLRGIDFYVVYIDGRKHRAFPLSIRGRQYVDICQKRHPKNAVIGVDLYESRESIKSKILREIELKKALSH